MLQVCGHVTLVNVGRFLLNFSLFSFLDFLLFLNHASLSTYSFVFGITLPKCSLPVPFFEYILQLLPDSRSSP